MKRYIREYLNEIFIFFEKQRDLHSERWLEKALHEGVSEEESKKLIKTQFEYLQFFISEDDYEDITTDAVCYAREKVEETGKEELRSWWTNIRFYRNLLLYKTGLY